MRNTARKTTESPLGHTGSESLFTSLALTHSRAANMKNEKQNGLECQNKVKWKKMECAGLVGVLQNLDQKWI